MSQPFTSRLAPAGTKINLDSLLRSNVLPYVLLTLIVGLSAVMRLYKLGEWSFWIDEVYNVNYARELWGRIAWDKQPSLVLVSLIMGQWGVSHWTARLGPALIGVFSLVLLYFPIRKMFGAPVALLAVLLMALSPWHLHWSQNSRFYTSLMFFYSLSAFVFFFALEEDSPGYFLLSLLFIGLAILERKIAAFWAPVMGVYMLAVALPYFQKPAGLRRRNLIAIGVPVLLFALYQIALVAFMGSEPFYAEFVEAFVGYSHNPVRVFMSIVYDVGLPLFLVALLGGVYLLLRGSRPGLFLVVNAVFPVAFLVIAAPFVQSFSRYVFITLPAWAVLAAVAVVELWRQVHKEGRLLALGVLVILLVEPLSQDVLYYTFQNGNRPDWQGAFQVVEQSQQPGDRVITTRVDIGEYYLEKDVEWTQGLKPKSIPAAGQRAWFVIDNRTGFVSPELEAWLSADARLVSVKDVTLPGKTMMMRVFLYDPGSP